IVGNGRRGAGKTDCQTGEIKACSQVEVTLRSASSAFARTDTPNANEAGLRRPRRTPQLNPMIRPSPEEGTRHRLGARTRVACSLARAPGAWRGPWAWEGPVATENAA